MGILYSFVCPPNDCENQYIYNDTAIAVGHYSIKTKEDKTLEDLIPTKIIYNGKTTIVFFRDGTKEIATCTEEDNYSKEAGVAQCIAKKLFGSRSAFLRAVESGKVQLTKEEKEAWKKQRKS